MSAFSQLDASITKMRSVGIPDDKIRAEAIKAGWNDAQIDAAFSASNSTNIIPPAPTPSFLSSVPTQTSTNNQPPPVLNQPVPGSTSGAASFLSQVRSGVTIGTMPGQFSQSSILNTNSPTSQNIGLNVPTAIIQNKKRHKKTFLFIFIIILMLGLLGAGFSYAYYKGLWLFDKPPFDESNLISGLVQKISEINSASYALTLSLYSEEREALAQPVNIIVSEDAELEAKYERDNRRLNDVGIILKGLNTYSKTTYPLSFEAVLSKISLDQSSTTLLKDPLTNENYKYLQIQKGKNFTLIVDFETDDAISKIEDYERFFGKSSATSTLSTSVDGKLVTFTKDSYILSDVTIKPPKTFFERMSDLSMILPPQINVTGKLSASSNLKNTDGLAAWKMNVSGNADFGDLALSLNIDALKRGKDYYLKINNFPEIFAGFLPPKGQWYKFTSSASSTDMIKGFGTVTVTLNPNVSAEETVQYLKDLVVIADRDGVINLKKPPQKVRENGRFLYKYDININKDGIVSFIEDSTDLARSKGFIDASSAKEQDLLNEINSSGFSQAFDYHKQNSSLTLWVDEEGFPVKLENSLRIVPPEVATQLAGKQIMHVIDISVSEINKPINIEIPTDAKPIEEYFTSKASTSTPQ